MASDSTSDITAQSSDGDPAADVVAPAMRRRLQQCYQHGSKLAVEETYDFDYANTMFTQCVVNDPSNLLYVEAFMNNLERKFENNKKRARGRGLGSKGGLKKAAAKQDWAEVLRNGPPLLKDNPWDVATLRAMAQACEALEYNEVELRYLKAALVANPKDPVVNQHCAESLTRMGQFDQAIACWHRVEEARPNDLLPEKMISDLTVAKAMGHSAKSRATARAAAKTKQKSSTESADQKQQVDAADESPRGLEIELTPRQKLERAIADDPTAIDSYRELADLLVDEGRYADAEAVLSKALSAAGNDLQVLDRLEYVQMQRAREQVAIAKKRAKTENTEQAAKLVKQLRSDLNRREMEIYYNRCRREPGNLALRYDLGLRLKKAGNFAEAVKCFAKAQKEPSRRAEAALEMGECQQYLKQYDKALQAYDQSIEADAEPSEAQKTALFRAGVLATGMRKLDAAQAYLTRLAEIDPNYKDVGDRLDKIEKIRHKG